MVMGDRIRSLLAERGISQAELARRVKLGQSTINGLINGHSQGTKFLHSIARELGTTSAYLAGETDDPGAEADEVRLSSDEERLLEIYRDLPKKDRSALKLLIERMVQDETKER
jgi:transcriptional regulator with XRE-family HTH domain